MASNSALLQERKKRGGRGKERREGSCQDCARDRGWWTHGGEWGKLHRKQKRSSKCKICIKKASSHRIGRTSGKSPSASPGSNDGHSVVHLIVIGRCFRHKVHSATRCNDGWITAPRHGEGKRTPTHCTVMSPSIRAPCLQSLATARIRGLGKGNHICAPCRMGESSKSSLCSSSQFFTSAYLDQKALRTKHLTPPSWGPHARGITALHHCIM